MTVPADGVPAPDAEPTTTKAAPGVPSVIKPHPSLPADSAVHPLSPSKRKISVEPGSSAPLTGLTESPSTISKRAKPDEAPPKHLPLKYEFCGVEDMVVLIAHMLGELIETNDALALRTGHLTRFHSRTPPGISVIDYLHRLAKHATLTPPLLLSMVYYIDRLCALYPEFTINTLTVHRFLITAATVAAKGLSDAFWNNSTYAKVGGVKVAELKLLELEFLYRVDWRIVPNPEVLVAYYRGLVERCPGFALEAEVPAAVKEDEEVGDAADERRVATAAAAAASLTIPVHIQPITVPSSAPVLLAEISHTPGAPSSTDDDDNTATQVTSYAAPELPESARLVRIGAYDAKAGRWTSSVTVASAENFGKGYSPHFVVNLDGEEVVGVTCRGVKVDAGYTRDFGPQARVVGAARGEEVKVNTPVVLSPEGRKVVVEEKSMIQKYWWVLAIGAFVVLSGGGDGK
ncbi:cyclin-domain-containing protein [Podospora conica]|nr:cyclin-domain-containing protein [Schizothecium conicum]